MNLEHDAVPQVVSKIAPGKVLLFAPTANDARITQEILTSEGIAVAVCQSLAHIRAMANEECGCILLAEETLQTETVSDLTATLQEQPSWSDIPVIIVTSGGEPTRETLRRLTLLGPGGNVTLLERPFRPSTLVSAVAVALKARSRQIEVHQLLDALNAAKTEAERANQAKDVFLATLSHELRTPLNPVLMIASIGAADTSLPPQVREDYSVIRKNIKLEARLIDDLLDLTRIAKGKVQLDRVPGDVHKILCDAIKNLEGDIRGKDIQLSEHYLAGDTNVHADPMRLQQVFWNVLRNAIKFASPGGSVTVETTNPDAHWVKVSITDTGIGISEAELARIFDAFTQGEHANGKTASPYGGLGLGLSISKILVELHEGKISARSDGLGHGATFVIELPTLQTSHPSTELKKAAQSPSPLEKSKPARHRPRILLVDDHFDTLTALAEILKRRYDVVTAGSGAEARACAAKQNFDLVISDIGLPDEPGYKLMDFLSQAHGLKGIALSGYGMDTDIVRSRQAGFLDHLIKPVEYDILNKTLEKHLPDGPHV